MNKVDFLVIGGSAAGTTAAEVFRSLKPQATIAIITDELYEEYSRILLSNYVRGEIEREKLFLKKAEWYQQKNIELIKNTKATSLDPAAHLVTLQNGEIYQYGKLLIATGGTVIKLQIPGGDIGNVFYFRTLDDADAIVRAVANCKKAVIVGGGFIGLDFATCFGAHRVEDVKVLVIEDYYWQGKLDELSSKVLQNTLEKNGIKILTNEEVESFEPSNNPQKGLTLKGAVGAVKTKSGKRLECDMVGIGVGIKSDFDWLSSSGIKVNRGIVTNEYLETNIPDVYAAGDCCEFWDVIFERQHVMGNWANATSQGLAVGKTIAGTRTIFETASSYSADFFDGSCSFIGVTDDDFAEQIVVRGSVENQKMTRIFIKTISGVLRIVGATVINNPAEVAPLTMAVKGKVDVSVHKDSLADPNFDLKNLVV